jgi:hypothetical protein
MKTQTKWMAPRTANCRTGNTHNRVFGDLYAKYRFEKSFFGYHPSIIKSGIQKYARRAEVQKGLWCLVEMDLFSLLELDVAALDAYLRKYPAETRKNTQTAVKRFRTNMVNRLVVMMTEEVNISAWWMPSKILYLFKKWIENRNTALSQKYLVDMYLYLTSQKMIRLISDLKSVFLLPPYYVNPDQMNNLMQIHYNIKERYPGMYFGQEEVGKLEWEVDMDGYPAAVRSCIKGIIYNLEKGSDNVFYWIHKLCDLERKDWVVKVKDKNKFNYNKCKFPRIVWKILHRFIDRNREYEFVREQISALEAFYKKMKHKEKPIYLYHAVLLLVRRKEIDWNSTAPQAETPMDDVRKRYEDHLRGGKMEIDDYVLDHHTKGGRKDSDSSIKFALEGAYVKNENTHFLNPEYRDIYILLKRELDLYHSRGRKLR